MEPQISFSQSSRVFMKIRFEYEALTPGFRRIADLVLRNPEMFLSRSISDLAAEAQVSPPSVSRFVRQLGFSDISQLKAVLRVDLLSPPASHIRPIEETDSTDDVVTKVFRMAKQGLDDTMASLNLDELRRAAQVIKEARRVEVFGYGGFSGPIAHLALYQLLKLGVTAKAVTEAYLQKQSAALLERGDVCLVVSNSGDNPYLLESVELAKKGGATTIILTNHAQSPLAQTCCIKLVTAAWTQAPSYGEAVTSRVVQLTVLDTLYSLISLEMHKAEIRGGKHAHEETYR